MMLMRLRITKSQHSQASTMSENSALCSVHHFTLKCILYGGLAALCDTGAGQEKFTFDTLFHNGLFEGTATARDGRHTYYTQLIDDRRALAALLRGETAMEYDELRADAAFVIAVADGAAAAVRDGVLA